MKFARANFIAVPAEPAPAGSKPGAGIQRRSPQSHWILATETEASVSGLSGAPHRARIPFLTLRGDDGIHPDVAKFPKVTRSVNMKNMTIVREAQAIRDRRHSPHGEVRPSWSA